MSELGPGFAGGRFGVQRLISDMSNYYESLLQEKNVIRHDLYLPGYPKTLQPSPTPEISTAHIPAVIHKGITTGGRKPRVLQIVNRLNLGGITYNAASIAARLRPDFDTMIVAGMKEESEESSEFMLKNLASIQFIFRI